MVLSIFLDKIEQQFAMILEHGTDEELALASYLQGHLDVVSAQIDMDTSLTEDFVVGLETSLQQAFEQGELDKNDQGTALVIWQNLKNLSYL